MGDETGDLTLAEWILLPGNMELVRDKNEHDQSILVNSDWHLIEPPDGGAADNVEVDKMLGIITTAFRFGVPLDPKILNFLTESLENIWMSGNAGKDAGEHLGYTRGRGAPKSGVGEVRKKYNYKLVEEWRKAHPEDSIVNAFEEVSGETGIPTGTLSNHYYDIKKQT